MTNTPRGRSAHSAGAHSAGAHSAAAHSAAAHDAGAGELAAAIDVGTNTVLLLVGRRAPDGGLEVVLDRCETPRLGRGVAARGTLAPDSAQQTLEVLRSFAADLARLGVAPARVRAVGTAVFRRARDAPAFVARVRVETGLPLEVASEAEEARLAYVAVVGAALGEKPADTLVIDVGGGSTELVSHGGATRLSAPVGAVVLGETFGLEHALTAPRFAELCAAARTACERFPADAGRAPGGEVVVLGGSAQNLAALVLGLERFDHERAEGAHATAADAFTWAERLARVEPAERLRWPIEPARAEILPAGLVCIGATLERIGRERARLSGRGLRFGLLQGALSEVLS